MSEVIEIAEVIYDEGEISEETLAELSNGKGDDDDE